MTLSEVKLFRVPRDLTSITENELRRAGANGHELFVLWTGTVTDGVFTARTPHVPVQTAYRLESGLCVRIEGQELHRLNRWLYHTQEVLAVQIHTHPTEAYHSTTDNTYPIVTEYGGLSIVLPDFAARGFADPGIATYRYTRSGWRHLSKRTTARLLEIF